MAVFLYGAAAGPAWAQSPLHERIDASIAAAAADFPSRAAPAASDAEFLRRIYLDLTGTIPTSAEARTFLNDADPDKRPKLIDRLLASPEYARHMARVFDVTLMERRPDVHVSQAEWQEYLRSSFTENKPWDQLVREILAADGADPKLRPAVKFYLDRNEAETNLLTRDIGRLFLGVNLQCAQCHDHPLVTDWLQEDYYGIYAFLNRSYVFKDKQNKAFFAEKAEGDVTYTSVFDPDKKQNSTGPHVPGGSAIEEPKLAKGQEYEVAAADGVRPIPKYSRRAALARVLPGTETAAFKRNIANRLWAMMMGRGLVHPLESHHSGNPPSHPELLDLLAEEFAAMKFDLKAWLRELALSQTYQRSSQLPEGAEEIPPQTFAAALLKPLSAEQLGWSMMQAMGLSDAQRLALGQNLTEQALYEKLAGNVAAFVATFGSAPGQAEGSFQATLDQALFLSNGQPIRGWLAPQPGNLADRLTKLSQSSEIADELYLSVLTRPPTDEERAELAEYLAARPEEKAAALQELIWSLITSAEFRLNH